MANQYGSLAAPPTIAQLRQQLINAGASAADVDALIAQPHVVNPTTGQLDPGFARAFAATLGKRGPAGVGTGILNQWLPWGFWDEHPTLARVLQFGAIAAPLAPLALGAGAAGGAGAGSGTAAASGGATAGEAAATGVLPSTITVPTATSTIGGLSSGTSAGLAAGGTSIFKNLGGGGSGVANWLGPLLQYGIPTAGALAGAQIQSTGIKEAAEIQAKSFADASPMKNSGTSTSKGWNRSGTVI